MTTVNYRINREIPVEECEILVIGAGPGGLGAAVTAARQGRKVILAESGGMPGGMASAGEIQPFMVNHLDGATLDRPIYVDWCRKMWELRSDPERGETFNEKINFDERIDRNLAALAAEALLIEAGVILRYHYNLADTVLRDGKITEAVFQTKAGFEAIRAQIYCDGTGDGDLAARAGCPVEFGNADGFCQPMTLCFKLGNVDIPRIPHYEELNALYDRAREAGELHCPRENILYFHAIGDNLIHFNTTRVIQKSGVEPRELSEAEVEGRQQLREFLRFFRTRVPGFENACLHSMGDRIGVRESRRIRGRVYQTAGDFAACRKYPDGIARFTYTIDIHNPSGSGTDLRRLPQGEWYELRYGTLVPEKCDNLLMACRAVSVDHALHSSVRVMPQVCSIGQAAGMAAAMAVERGTTPPELDGADVRARLKAFGASL